MYNHAGMRLSGALTRYLESLEEEVGIPIRLLDMSQRVAAPTRPQREEFSNATGISTVYLSPSDESGYPWDPQYHPSGMDMDEGLSIMMRAPLGRFENLRPIDIAEYVNDPGFNDFLNRIGNDGDYFYYTYPEEYPDWLHDVQTFDVPGWDGGEAYGYEPLPFATGALMDEVGRVLAYSCRGQRARFGDGQGRISYDQMFGDPVRAMVGDSEDFRARMAERSRTAFAEFSTGRIGARTREARSEVTRLEGEAELHASSYRTVMDRLREQKLTLDTLAAMERGENAGLDPDAEWAALERHEKIERIFISGGRITVETTELELTDPDTHESVPLGKMRITFPMQPGSGRGMQITNMSNAIEGRAHPHVPGNPGAPCFGSLMAEIARMGASGEVGGMIETALQFLQTYNPRDDYGRYGGLWFEGEVRSRVRD